VHASIAVLAASQRQSQSFDVISRVTCLGNDLSFRTKSETAIIISDFNLRILEDEESFER